MTKDIQKLRASALLYFPLTASLIKEAVEDLCLWNQQDKLGRTEHVKASARIDLMRDGLVFRMQEDKKTKKRKQSYLNNLNKFIAMGGTSE